MGEFRPTVAPPVDFGDAIRAQQARRDREEQTAAIAAARHEKEVELVAGLIGRGYRLKVLQADPRFNSITGPEWNTLSETERLAREDKKKQASLGEGQFAGIAEQGVAASGPGGTVSQKQAFMDRLNPGDPGELNQLAGRMDSLKQQGAATASGSDLSQLGATAVKVGDEKRQLATTLAAEGRSATRAAAKPQAQMEEFRLEYINKIRSGEPVSDEDRKAIDEMNRMSPLNQLLSAAFAGANLGGGTSVELSTSDQEISRKKLMTEFKADTESSKYTVVSPNMKDSFEAREAGFGHLIVRNKVTGKRRAWSGEAL